MRAIVSAMVLAGLGSILALSADAIPAVTGTVLTALGALWMIYAFLRDKRVRMAEADLVEVHRTVAILRRENDDLRTELTAAHTEVEALTAELRSLRPDGGPSRDAGH